MTDSPDLRSQDTEGQATGADAGARRTPMIVVGVGASAGGLEALKRLFSAMPSHPRLAFVVIVHLSPKHPSMMAQLLSSSSALPVTQVRDGDEVTPGRVYVIPPNQHLRIEKGVLRLETLAGRPQVPSPIDHFMQSLAEDQQYRAVGIVLTGADHDGTSGLKHIKAAGGLTLAQDPQTAAHPGMPSSALASEPDWVLPIEQMPGALIEWVEHRFPSEESDDGWLHDVLEILLARTGQDFRKYRRPMLARRVRRRASLNRIATLRDYLARLRDSADEARDLAKDLLIGVTEYFRDPQAWHVLETQVLPQLKPAEGKGVRVWSVGCSTGEEVYSLAMLLCERFPDRGATPVVVFGSDIDLNGLRIAREGAYASSIEANIPAPRLHRFLRKTGDRYVVRNELRKLVLFAAQNVLSDPPFSRLDLIACRNLLIYLEPGLQQRVLELFHYALNPGGYLFLGKSENLGACASLFEPISTTWRIYRSLRVSSRRPRALPPRLEFRPQHPASARDGDGATLHAPGEIAQRALLESHTPAAVLVQAVNHRALYFHGSTDKFLSQPRGDADWVITGLVRDGLRIKLRAALHRADREDRSVQVDARMERDGRQVPVRMCIEPLQRDGLERMHLVTFLELPPDIQAPTPQAASPFESTLLRRLEQELLETRRELQSTVEDLETANQELRVSNEEALSMNEELQSSNEELETSQEELQSVNEELNTVNRQLEEKLHELEQSHADLSNLLVSTHIPTLFLDRDLRIQRYTPAATGLFRLIPSDLYRPIQDITSNLEDEALPGDIHAVLEKQAVREAEVRSKDGRHFLRRVLPYLSGDDDVHGAVLTFTDISELRRATRGLARLAMVVRDSNDAILLHDARGRILSWNQAAERTYGYSVEEALELEMDALVPESCRAGDAERTERVSQGQVLPPWDTQRVTKSGVVLDVSVTVSALRDSAGQLDALVSTERDITQRKRMELSLREERFRAMADNVPALIWMTDAFRRAEYINKTFSDFTGKDPGALQQERWGEFIHADDLPGFESSYLEAFQSRSRFESDLRLRRFDGVHRWMRALGVPRFGGEGEFRGFLVLTLDMHERKLAEQALSEADHRKDEFLAMLAHELRNPLAPIRSAGDVIARLVPADSKVAWATAIIERQTDQLSRLVDDLLDVARISRGKVLFNPQPLDLTVAVQRALEISKPLIESRNHQLVVRLPEERLPVRGDLLRLAQVFGNLLNNAAKFTPEGGTITVEARREGDRARVRVSDTGAGIAPDQLEGIFGLFVQAHSTLSRSEGGLGLGLTLAQRLVQLHGGRVEAHSAGLGQGSTFVVDLPVKELPGEKLEREHSVEEPCENAGLRILVVDDNADAAESLALLLQLSGHEARTAHDGETALEIVSGYRPQVVILDVGLPGLSGYDVARQLRGRKETANALLIAVTGYGRPEDIFQSRAAGFDHHLLKPVQHDALESSLATLKRRRSGG